MACKRGFVGKRTEPVVRRHLAAPYIFLSFFLPSSLSPSSSRRHHGSSPSCCSPPSQHFHLYLPPPFIRVSFSSPHPNSSPNINSIVKFSNHLPAPQSGYIITSLSKQQEIHPSSRGCPSISPAQFVYPIQRNVGRWLVEVRKWPARETRERRREEARWFGGRTGVFDTGGGNPATPSITKRIVCLTYIGSHL